MAPLPAVTHYVYILLAFTYFPCSTVRAGGNKVWEMESSSAGGASAAVNADAARRPPPPPSSALRPGYECNRCGKPGHHIRNCPTNGNPAYDRGGALNGGGRGPSADPSTVTVTKVQPNKPNLQSRLLIIFYRPAIAPFLYRRSEVCRRTAFST
jgi:hypothetical protein